MKLKEALKATQAIDAQIEPYPHRVWTTFFSTHCKAAIVGEQFSLGPDSDFVSEAQVKEALEWFVDQFGGSIKWGKK